MTDHLEDLISAEAVRQGFKANADAVRAAVVDLAGSRLTEDRLIHMPGRGSISAADFVRDLHSRMPSAFSSLADERKSETATTGNLTESYRQEVAASRHQRALPDDWLDVRSKVTGITAQHMAERERNWK